ncbi:MAG: hypothetical protein AABZ36_01905, partial [Nitrospirota bacterium]
FSSSELLGEIIDVVKLLSQDINNDKELIILDSIRESFKKIYGIEISRNVTLVEFISLIDNSESGRIKGAEEIREDLVGRDEVSFDDEFALFVPDEIQKKFSGFKSVRVIFNQEELIKCHFGFFPSIDTALESSRELSPEERAALLDFFYPKHHNDGIFRWNGDPEFGVFYRSQIEITTNTRDTQGRVRLIIIEDYKTKRVRMHPCVLSFENILKDGFGFSKAATAALRDTVLLRLKYILKGDNDSWKFIEQLIGDRQCCETSLMYGEFLLNQGFFPVRKWMDELIVADMISSASYYKFERVGIKGFSFPQFIERHIALDDNLRLLVIN